MKSKTSVEAIFVATLVIVDATLAALAFVLAYWLRWWIPWPDPAQGMGPITAYWAILMLHAVAVVVSFAFSGLYRQTRSMARVEEFFSIFVSSTVATLMGVAFDTMFLKNSPTELDYSRAMIFYGWVCTIPFITIGRIVHGQARARLRRRGWGRDRVLVVGTGEVGRMIVQKIQSNPGLGYEVVGMVGANGLGGAQAPATVLGRAQDLAAIISGHQVEEVIIGLPEATHQEILALISECERGKVTIKVYPDVFQIMASQVSIGDLGGVPLLTVRDIALRGWRRSAKRAMDLVGGAILLVLLSPLMILMAVLIKLDSRGPVFYAQERMGLDARPFWMIKFRSMRADAESRGPGWTVKDDPRVTRLGRFIRQINIDELPQLINVVMGEMSLVGPRPERPVYVEQFRRSIPRYMDRHWEKAGMTGWAQANGLRGDTSISERTKYDLWYIENWSLLLDIRIIVRTIFNFFRAHNAY